MYVVLSSLYISIPFFYVLATDGRFYPRAVNPLLGAYLRVGVIGMQAGQVAKTPVECFVNGQMCLSTSEPISHSKVWHHVKLPPNHSCVMCLTQLASESITSTVLYVIVSFDFSLGRWPLFRLIGLDPSVPGSVYCD